MAAEHSGLRSRGSARGVQKPANSVWCRAMNDPTPDAGASVGAGRLLLAVAVGIAVGLVAFPGVLAFLPKPWSGNNLLPYELSAMLGSLAGMGTLVPGSPRWRRRWLLMAATWATTLAFLVPIIELGTKDMLHRRQFHKWVPILAGTGCALWVGSYVAELLAKRRLVIFTVLLAGVSLCSVSLQNGKYMHDSLAGNRVRAWNVYHYYVGSKYFEELSYFGLYSATLAADDAWQAKKKKMKGDKKKRAQRVRDFRALKKARDMRDYQVKKRSVISKSFSDYTMEKPRFRQLGRDTRFLRPFLGVRPPGWVNTLQDLGYNPAPPWTLVGVPLSNAVPPKFPQFHLISNSDVPLYILTFLLLWWGFGLRVASAMALWCCTIQFNESRFAGGFLQYDWFASTLICAAFYRRGWYKSAGVALTWGAMTRVFPGFLILPFVMKVGIDAARGLRSGGTLRSAHGAIKARHWNFLLAFTLACGVLFVGSHFTGRGLQTWPEWVEKIGRHSETHAVTSNQRVGVGRLAIHAPAPGKPWAELSGSREERLETAHPRKRRLQLLGLLLLLPALIRRRDLDGFVLAMFSVFCAVVLSRYYASTWSIFFLLGAAGIARPGASDPDAEPGVGPGPDRNIMGLAGCIGGGALLFMAASFYLPGKTTASYFYVNWIFYLLCIGLCVGYLFVDVKALLARADAPAPGMPDYHPVGVVPGDSPQLSSHFELEPVGGPDPDEDSGPGLGY